MQVTSENITNTKFTKICEEWISYKKPKIKESTFSNYNFKIEKYLKPSFEKSTIQNLLNFDINTYVSKLQKNLSSKTVKDTITILKSILRYTERKYNLDFKLDLISSPLLDKKEVQVFNDKEKKRLEKYLVESNNIKHLGILISLFAGLRIGEVCCLKWSDIDFEDNLINVNHTIQRIYLGKNKTKVIMTTPKTKKSIRKIPLAKILCNKLKPISKMYSQDAFILTGKKDKFMEPLGYKYTYKVVLNECNIEYKKYHCLRHTFATKCVAVGMDVKSLSEVLGHSNISVTLDFYVYSSYDVKKKFIDRL